MAKFLKSMFHTSPTEKRHEIQNAHEPEAESDSPISDRRKLSMSRSGRLKHSNKKRHELNLELYGNDELQATEKPKSMEYHVNSPATTPEPPIENQKRISAKVVSIGSEVQKDTKKKPEVETSQKGDKSPEEEIDSAFEIIDKS